MMSIQMSIIKERLEQILPGWNITDDLEAISKTSHFNITEHEMNQVIQLGLTVSGIYRSQDTVVVSFANARGLK